ncbi:MAG: hypothetical protein J6Q39_08355 [Bacteroidales bacterium]|nr:hypothetical protein [Bacteroidales bacterium]
MAFENSNVAYLESPITKNGIKTTTRLKLTRRFAGQGKIIIDCTVSHHTQNGFFLPSSGDGYVQINGVSYPFSYQRSILDSKTTSKELGSITSDPIELYCIDDQKQKIDIAMRFDGKVSYFENENDILATVSSSYLTMNNYSISVGAVYKSTPVTVSGTTITEQSTIDIVNKRTHEGATHSLSYTCGDITETLFTEDAGDYFTFTLPDTLAAQNTNGTDLSVTFTLTTHFPFGVSGSKSSTVLFAIPDKDIFRPKCTVEVTDGEHLDHVPLVDRYGGFVLSKSRFKIKVTPILAFGSEVATCTIKANDETHVGYMEAETAMLKHSGVNDIVVTLVDNRGRSCEVSTTANVLDYQKPYVNNLSHYRCDRDGVSDSDGDYIKITFGAEITPLNNKNSARYVLRYQTSAGLDQTDVNLTEYAGQYSVVAGSYIFQADSGNTYSITLTAFDDLDSGFEHEGADDATTIWNALASGDGFAFGTIASLAGVLETMFKFFPHKGFMFPEFEGSTLMTANHVPNVYTIKSGKDIEKSPFDGEYTLIVLPGGGVGDFLLIAITCDLEIKINSYANSSWSGNWKTLTVT